MPANLVRRPRARIKWRLMGGTEQNARIVLDQILRAVAMMHVEIDNRDPFQPVMVQRMLRRHSDRSKKTKPHRRLAFGVVTGRAHGSKGIGNLAAQNQINPPHDSTRRPIGRSQSPNRHMRVGIKRAPALARGGVADGIDVALGVDAQQIIVRDKRRIHTAQIHFHKRAQHCIKPRDLFGMTGRGDVIIAISMGDQGSYHCVKEHLLMGELKRKVRGTSKSSKKIVLTQNGFFNRLSRVAPCQKQTRMARFWGNFVTKDQSNRVNDLGPRMRRQRHRLGLTLQQLGTDSGVSVGYLSQVERGNATPTLGTLSQIAAALHVGVDFFIATPKTVDSLTRAAQRPQFSVSGSSIAYEQIGADFPGHELTSFILHVPAGYTSEEVSHEGEEMIYILDGAIAQVVDGVEHTMTAGDSLHYLGTSPHSWSNKTDAPARILWVGRMQYEKSGKAKPENGAQRGKPSVMSALAPN